MNIKALCKISAPFKLSWQSIKGNWLGVFSFVFAFMLMITFIDITLSRNAAIRNIKVGINQLITDLNEIGLDIAYDKIEFNNIFIYPLVTVENLQLYNLKGTALWKISIPELSGRPRLFGSTRINLRTGDTAQLSIDKNTYNISLGSAKIIIEIGTDGSLKELQTYLKNTAVKDFVKIKNITFASRHLHKTLADRILTPSFENHLEIKNLKFNGLINYPLAAEIQRIYAKFNLMGSLRDGETFMLAAENWLRSGGFIDIPSLMINWPPLLLVGRGDVYFDENFAPKLQLQTSSKALLELLNDMQEKSYLDRKGVFVANILLGSKAFKMHDEDKYLTITTPITYRDNKLAVENITIKTFAPKNAQ